MFEPGDLWCLKSWPVNWWNPVSSAIFFIVLGVEDDDCDGALVKVRVVGGEEHSRAARWWLAYGSKHIKLIQKANKKK